MTFVSYIQWSLVNKNSAKTKLQLTRALIKGLCKVPLLYAIKSCYHEFRLEVFALWLSLPIKGAVAKVQKQKAMTWQPK